LLRNLALFSLLDAVSNSETHASIDHAPNGVEVTASRSGKNALASAAGTGSKASATGDDSTAIAAGSFAHAKLQPEQTGGGDVAAVGTFCLAESAAPFSHMTAVGIGPMALSHSASCPAVAVGSTPIAEARVAGGWP
jgi:hypothetical protein